MGHPVAADPLYGDSGGTTASRLALHAWRYTLPEPWSGVRTFSCDLAPDLRDAIEALRACIPPAVSS
jgi:23S rRNA-/tRNA-specific pseudouridylate synthase